MAAAAALSAGEALDEVRKRASAPHHVRAADCGCHSLARTHPRVVCAQAERLLVAGSFAEAADAAQRVLTDALAGAGGEDDDAEDVSYAAAAVLLQARRFTGDTPATLRASLEATFGTLRAVPPDALVLWCELLAWLHCANPCASDAGSHV